MHVTVLGAGAWGTALAMQSSLKNDTTLWAHNVSHVQTMQKTHLNERYLPSVTLPNALRFVSDFSQAVSDADLILSVVPTKAFRATLQQLNAVGSRAPVIWANKGLEPATALLPHEVAAEVLGDTVPYGVLSGPSFAAELARGLPTAVTVASADATFAKEAAEVFHAGAFRVYSSQDVVGVSVGGALKNVMAIASGISDGMGFGNNARAALITRGLAEMMRFGLVLGGQKETFMGLAGAGDLVLTCTGNYSRNREVGLKLAEGLSLAGILESLGHVAEGVHTTREVAKRAQTLGVEMPITYEVDQVISVNKSPKQAVLDLLSREQKEEG